MKNITLTSLLFIVMILRVAPAICAPPADGVNDVTVINSAVAINTDALDDLQRKHLPTVIFSRTAKALIVDISANHSVEPEESLEGVRLYQNEKFITKILLEPQFIPPRWRFYLNPEEFPMGSRITVLLYCSVYDAFKKEFVIDE